MKLPHGFGKNYFTFSSMLAHNIVTVLQSRATSSEIHDLDDSSPDKILITLCELNAKPCHCDCFYKLRTKLALLINHFIPRCPFYTVCFAFRRTGVHPPLFIS